MLKITSGFFSVSVCACTLSCVNKAFRDTSAEMRARKNFQNANLGSFFGGEFIIYILSLSTLARPDTKLQEVLGKSARGSGTSHPNREILIERNRLGATKLTRTPAGIDFEKS